MRKNGTKYETISKLPASAMPVSKFAELQGTSVPQIYIKYERFVKGESKIDPGYTIRCFQGSNFILAK